MQHMDKDALKVQGSAGFPVLEDREDFNIRHTVILMDHSMAHTKIFQAAILRIY